MGDNVLRIIYRAFVSSPLLLLYQFMMKDVASHSLATLTPSLTCMNLVGGKWPQSEVYLFLSSTAKLLIHELRIRSKFTHFVRVMSEESGNSLQTCPYMGGQLAPLIHNMPSTHHLD